MTTSSWLARLVTPDDAIEMGAATVVREVEGDPDSPKIPGSTVKVSVPAVVPVEKTILGCALSVMAVDPALTAKEATRLEVATNCTALSLVTELDDGVKER